MSIDERYKLGKEALANVKTDEDFLEWRKLYGPFLISQAALDKYGHKYTEDETRRMGKDVTKIIDELIYRKLSQQ